MINRIISENIEIKESKTAIVDSDFRVNYQELFDKISNLSSYLSGAGIKKGDKVCLYLPNSAEFIVGFFAITNLGAICVPVNAKYKPAELAHYISYSDAAFLLTASGLMDLVRQAHCDIRTLIIKGEGADWDIKSCGKVLFESEAKIDENDKAIYLFSTGSTGVPKCVARNHANLLALAENHTSTVEWDSSDKIFFVIPLSHTYAFGNLISALKIGAEIHILEDFNRKKVFDYMFQNSITIFPAVPFMIDMLSGYEPARDLDFSTLKHVISAGAPLRADSAVKFYENIGIYPRQLYGSSETGVISINLAEDIDKRLGSVGRPVKNVEVRIVDEQDKKIDAGAEGEITIKSPSMTDRYENLPEESEAVFRGGYYYTGDIGRLDEEGYIYITGRKKLFINISGQKVDPGEVEAVILLNDDIAEVAVLGRKRESGTEYAAAYIVSKKELKASDIVKFCRDKISDIKIPSVIKFVKEIPKSPTGKVLRDRLE